MIRHSYLNLSKPIAIAHRGGAKYGFENTMEAFDNAISIGYKYLETDVHVTSDDRLVVFHDDTLDRVTDGKGYIYKYTWSELNKIKIGGKFKIPLLEDLILSWPKTNFNLDPKNDNVIMPLINFLKNNKVLNRICVGSFSDKRLNVIRKAIGSELCTSACPSEVFKVKFSSLPMINSNIDANCIQVPIYYLGIQIIKKSFIEAAHNFGLMVHVWTINEKKEIELLLDLGVDGIISDNIKVLKKVFKERNIW